MKIVIFQYRSKETLKISGNMMKRKYKLQCSNSSLDKGLAEVDLRDVFRYFLKLDREVDRRRGKWEAR